MYVHINIHSFHAFTWLSITHVFMVLFLQLSNTRLLCLFLCLACRPPAHLLFSISCFFCYAHFSSVSFGGHLHLFAITKGWFSQRNFFQVLQISISHLTSVPHVTNLLDTHRTSLNSSLWRPIDLRKLLKKCSQRSSSNLTLVQATSLVSPTGERQVNHSPNAFSSSPSLTWFLKSWSAAPTM